MFGVPLIVVHVLISYPSLPVPSVTQLLEDRTPTPTTTPPPINSPGVVDSPFDINSFIISYTTCPLRLQKYLKIKNNRIMQKHPKCFKIRLFSVNFHIFGKRHVIHDIKWISIERRVKYNCTPGVLIKKWGGGGSALSSSTCALPCPLAHVLLYLTLIEV